MCSQRPYPLNSLPFHCPAQKTGNVQTSIFCLKEIPAVTRSLTWVFSFPFPGGVWAGASEQRGGHAGGGLAVPLGGLPAASTPRGSGDRPGALREAWSRAQTVRRVGPQLTGITVRASLPPCGHRHSQSPVLSLPQMGLSSITLWPCSLLSTARL